MKVEKLAVPADDAQIPKYDKTSKDPFIQWDILHLVFIMIHFIWNTV